MASIVIITALESGFGFLLTTTIQYLVLKNSRKNYQYLFAAFLFICVVWDFGILLIMLRNIHADELDIIGRIAVLPCVFIPALLFHFTNLYTGRVVKWAVILVWLITALTWIPILMGIFYQIEGYYSYDWGNIFRVVPTLFDPAIFVAWFGINLASCWLLIRSARKIPASLERRHLCNYQLTGSHFCHRQTICSFGNKPGVYSSTGDVPQ